MDKTVALSQNELFDKFSGGSRKALAGICLPKNYHKKEILFLEGEKGYFMAVLVKGHVQLYKTAPDGREVVIKVIRPGEIFGEVILFEEDRYPVSARALSDSLVFLIPKHQFHCLLQDELFRKEFIANLMSKMRYLADQIRDLSHENVEERLRRFLSSQFGKKPRITVKLSKKDVAIAIGTTPETLSRLLVRLKDERKLAWKGQNIEIESRFWTVEKED